MKKTLFFLFAFVGINAFGQHTFDVTGVDIKEAKNHNYDHFRYANLQPKIMTGTYFTSGTTERFGTTNQYEISVTLKDDGSCETMYYNSGMVGNVPKRKKVNGTWGLAVDKENKPIIAEKTGETWYRIVLVSNNPDEKLAYYDRTAYYDWIIIDSADKTYLRFIFSSNPKVAKQE